MMEEGFERIAGAVPLLELSRLRERCEVGSALPGHRQTSLSREMLRSIAQSQSLSSIAAERLGSNAHLARVLLFDKSPAANWGVPWHQDRSIAVRSRADVPGYRCWTERDGYWQVEPPADLLERMVTLRVHHDDCDETSGPLLVLPGTHGLGRLQRERIAALVAEGPVEVCAAREGDVLAMRPLIIHASRKASRPARRRILHLEYSACHIPAPLEWALAA